VQRLGNFPLDRICFTPPARHGHRARPPRRHETQAAAV
jgi:hypothetical protein